MYSNCHKMFRADKHSQSGSTLITALIMLTILAIIGTSSYRSATLKERTAQEAQEAQLAYEAAASAVLYAEKLIRSPNQLTAWSTPLPSGALPSEFYVTAALTNSVVGDDDYNITTPNTNSWDNTSSAALPLASWKQPTGTTLPQPAPRYKVELMSCSATAFKNYSDPIPNDRCQANATFRIYGFGEGRRAGTTTKRTITSIVKVEKEKAK